MKRGLHAGSDPEELPVAMRPPVPSLTLSRRGKVALWVLAILVVIVIALLQFTGVYINWLWFGSLGFRHVYTTIFWTRLTLFAIFGVLMALILGGNVWLAYRLRPPFRPMSAEQQNIERYRVVLEPRRWWVLGGLSAIALLWSGLTAQGHWATWQAWLNGVSFGQKDPQFHKDIGFYVWDYPAYRLMLGFGFTAVILAIILSLVVHYLCGAIRVQTPGPKFTLAARRHITALVFVFVVLKALAYWLDRYGFVFSSRSKFTGASYTDVHAALPARTILFWIALVIAAGLLASLWLNNTLLPGIAFVSMLVISILIAGIYPAVLQSVSVKPNASTKEVPYIKRNIEATQDAYGIQNVTYDTNYGTTAPVADAINSTSISTDPTLENIRILDPNIISPTFLNQQQDGNVYGFASKLDVDRYTLPDGTESDYIVGVREVDASNLTGDQANWINEHTNYTHGYGFVAAAADQDITNGAAYTEGDIPQTGPLTLKNPDVYYGELMPDYSIVGAKGAPQESDGDLKGAKVSYQGSGGVSLGNIVTRLAFAVKYKEPSFVLNNIASASGAKVIFNRDPREAVEKAAPFLTVDSDPYPIIDTQTGDIVWMVDAYTTTNNYPYSQRNSLSSLTDDSLSQTDKTASQTNDSVNYIRNSVKATVDAYTGKVTLYQWDTSDPVLKTWMKVFPGLVKPKSSMPQAILSHVRYPEDLFKVQRAILGSYHVTPSQAVQFYNQTQVWTVPTDPTSSTPTGANLPPYYVLAAPPEGGNSAQFQLTSPMNVNGQNYLAAYISADSDPADYGKITVLVLPRTQTGALPGPGQVYNAITTNASIRKDSLYAAGQTGSSQLFHGNLLTLPLGNSFMYVEPLYTQSTGNGGAFPVLSRVIVYYDGKFGYEATLAGALEDFAPGRYTGETLGLSPPSSGSTATGAGSSGSGATSSPTSSPTSTPTSSTSTSPPSTGGSDVTVQQLNTAYTTLQNAYKTGNQATIGEAEANVLNLLSKYLAEHPNSSLPSTGIGTASSTPSASRTPSSTPSSSGG